MSTRLIHRSAASPSRDIAECLEGLLVYELLNPGQRMLIVSPWMSDFPALDNRGGQVHRHRRVVDSHVRAVLRGAKGRSAARNMRPDRLRSRCSRE